jgi:hypothetical protein
VSSTDVVLHFKQQKYFLTKKISRNFFISFFINYRETFFQKTNITEEKIGNFEIKHLFFNERDVKISSKTNEKKNDLEMRFEHKAKNWNLKMVFYIYIKRNRIYIYNIKKTYTN